MNSGGHSNAGGLFIESALLQVRLQDFEQKYKLLTIFMQQYFQTFIESLAIPSKACLPLQLSQMFILLVL